MAKQKSPSTLRKFTVLTETSKAILADFGTEKVWLPKSQLEQCEIDYTDKTGNAYIPDWFLNKNQI